MNARNDIAVRHPDRDIPGRPTHSRSEGDALALAHLVREAVAAGVEREVLHLQLSRIAPQLRHGHHKRLVSEAMAPVMRPARSRLFALSNGDLVAVAPPQGSHLAQAKRTLATLLGLADTTPSVIALLALPKDAVALLAAIEDSLGSGPLRDEIRPDGALLTNTSFSLEDLACLERALAGASLARFLRHRPVCRLFAGGSAEFRWEEWRLAWPELRAALLPGPDPDAAPMLRRRLRRGLERRLLAELADPAEARRRGPIGLSLAVESLATEEFLRFDSLLAPLQRANVTLALAVEDLFADAEGFEFTRSFARVRGYRVALDVTEIEHLSLLSSTVYGDDLVRLRWTTGLPRLSGLLPANPNRIVLTGADRAATIGWGWEQGISLFEGRILDPR